MFLVPTTSYHEPDVLALVATGDEEAFAELFHHYRRKVYFIAWQVLKSEAASEDVLQEIFLTVWKERENLVKLGNFNSWLNTITRNHLVNRLRKQSSEVIYIKDTLYRSQNDKHETLDVVDWNDLHKILLESLAELPEQQRKVFEMARIEGLKQGEIAAEMGIARNTVKRHMAEALKNIRAHFSARGHDLGIVTLLLWTLGD